MIRGFVQWDTAPPSSDGDVTIRWSSRLRGGLELRVLAREEPRLLCVGGGAAQLYVRSTQDLTCPRVGPESLSGRFCRRWTFGMAALDNARSGMYNVITEWRRLL